MKLEIFSPSDFKSMSSSEIMCDKIRSVISNRANEILNKWLKENGVRVSGSRFDRIWEMYEDICGIHTQSATHKALLIQIEPIKKCEHKKVVYVEDRDKTWFQCRDCNLPVKAKGWDTV